MEVQRGIAPGTWDETLIQQGGDFLQSTHWQRFQQRLGREVLYCSGSDWSWAGYVLSVGPFAYLNVPNGPTCNQNWAEAARTLRLAASEMDFVRTEPIGRVSNRELRQNGFRQVRPRQPQHSWVIDISQPEEDLRRQLSELRRRNLKAAGKHGITVRRSYDVGDVESFISLMHATADRANFSPHPDEYYRVMVRELLPSAAVVLYFAEVDNEPAAAVLGFDFGNTRAYAHAASNPEFRQTNPATPLIWQMILDAKADGKTRWDFWGVMPPGSPSDHPWAGFSRFKQSFGGELVSKLGAWELPLRRWRYSAFTFASEFGSQARRLRQRIPSPRSAS